MDAFGAVKQWSMAASEPRMRTPIGARQSLGASTFPSDARTAFSPDGRFVAITPGSAALGDSRIVFLDARTGKEAATVKVGAGSLMNLAFSRDERSSNLTPFTYASFCVQMLHQLTLSKRRGASLLAGREIFF